ncbi:MAG: hypothetical protein BJ554DRAFT_3103, partial [Olpidium bornovanus]
YAWLRLEETGRRPWSVPDPLEEKLFDDLGVAQGHSGLETKLGQQSRPALEDGVDDRGLAGGAGGLERQGRADVPIQQELDDIDVTLPRRSVESANCALTPAGKRKLVDEPQGAEVPPGGGDLQRVGRHEGPTHEQHGGGGLVAPQGGGAEGQLEVAVREAGQEAQHGRVPAAPADGPCKCGPLSGAVDGGPAPQRRHVQHLVCAAADQVQGRKAAVATLSCDQDDELRRQRKRAVPGVAAAAVVLPWRRPGGHRSSGALRACARGKAIARVASAPRSAQSPPPKCRRPLPAGEVRSLVCREGAEARLGETPCVVFAGGGEERGNGGDHQQAERVEAESRATSNLQPPGSSPSKRTPNVTPRPSPGGGDRRRYDTICSVAGCPLLVLQTPAAAQTGGPGGAPPERKKERGEGRRGSGKPLPIKLARWSGSRPPNNGRFTAAHFPRSVSFVALFGSTK